MNCVCFVLIFLLASLWYSYWLRSDVLSHHPIVLSLPRTSIYSLSFTSLWFFVNFIYFVLIFLLGSFWCLEPSSHCTISLLGQSPLSFLRSAHPNSFILISQAVNPLYHSAWDKYLLPLSRHSIILFSPGAILPSLSFALMFLVASLPSIIKKILPSFWYIKSSSHCSSRTWTRMSSLAFTLMFCHLCSLHSHILSCHPIVLFPDKIIAI